ncbi:hypothetical protein TIFTF001_034140 [Ficus carica]|uniref:Uncharacterized protein n=1 Tax=Ficus carica TaxID=3494 RepID=A0AA88E282_FICCA|nr:hypothetical protein TIFTF001_034140 [Ficus carica]
MTLRIHFPLDGSTSHSDPRYRDTKVIHIETANFGYQQELNEEENGADAIGERCPIAAATSCRITVSGAFVGGATDPGTEARSPHGAAKSSSWVGIM